MLRRRDVVWRTAGALLAATSCAGAQVGLGGSAATVAYVVSGIGGVVLLINGRRSITLLKAEWRGRLVTANAVHLARRRRGASAKARQIEASAERAAEDA
jgi:hypothetical protein